MGVRGLLVSTAERFLYATASQRAARCEAARAEAEQPAPFSFVLLRDAPLLSAVAGQLLWPGRSLRAATNEIVERSFAQLAQLPMLSPLFLTCEGDLRVFLDEGVRGNSLFSNHGQARHERLGPGRSRLRYDGFSAAAISMINEGYFRAVLARFGLEGEVRFEVYGPQDFDIKLRWRHGASAAAGSSL